MNDNDSLPKAPNDPVLLALGFSLAHEAVDTAIVGTRDSTHMRPNLRLVEHELPLAEETLAALQYNFDDLGSGWSQQGYLFGFWEDS